MSSNAALARLQTRPVTELAGLQELTLCDLSWIEELCSVRVDWEALLALQSLTISNCFNVTALTTGIGVLVALKHLTLVSLGALPRGIGELAALERLKVASLNWLRKVPDLSRLTSLQELTIEKCDELKLLRGISELAALKHLTLCSLGRLVEMPDLARLTSLQELTIEECEELTLLPGIGELAALKRLTLASLHSLKKVPDLARLMMLQELTISTCALKALPDLARLTSLQELTISECTELTALPRGIGELKVLKRLTLASLYHLEEVPDLARLTSLQELTIEECDELTLLPGIGELAALKRLTLVSLYVLKKVPDLSRLTSLQELTISECEELMSLPIGIGELAALKQLSLDCNSLCNSLYRLDIPEMPNLARLTSLQELTISACILGRLKLPERIVELSALIKLHIQVPAADEAEAALSFPVMCRALKAWPLTCLEDFKVRVGQVDFRLSNYWQQLGLPSEAATWSTASTLDFLRVQQLKVAAFASGLQKRLGAASGVSMLNDQVLIPCVYACAKTHIYNICVYTYFTKYIPAYGTKCTCRTGEASAFNSDWQKPQPRGLAKRELWGI